MLSMERCAFRAHATNVSSLEPSMENRLPEKGTSRAGRGSAGGLAPRS
jgi:hypothetical protein